MTGEADHERSRNLRLQAAEQVVALCQAGRISAPVALSRLVFAGYTLPEIAASLPDGSAIAHLFTAQRERLAHLIDMLNASGTRHGAPPGTAEEMVAATAAMFERAVALSPEASVAAYSLGDDALLAAATDELVEWLRRETLMYDGCDVLDFGCGIGRVAGALAGQAGSILGLDVSQGMIAEARRRAQADNTRFSVTDGKPSTHLADESFDLVLAIDSMPYLVQAGIADAHVADLFRLLRQDGALVVLNLSYRNDPDADAADAERWAKELGGALVQNGIRPFQLWDGRAFVLRKPDHRQATSARSRH